METTNIEATENVVEEITESVVETTAKNKYNGIGVIIGCLSGIALTIGGYFGYKYVKSKKVNVSDGVDDDCESCDKCVDDEE